MLFGLKYTPISWMDLMNSLYKEYLDKFVIVFIDNILIYSYTRREHEEYLRIALHMLRENKLYVK